MAKKEKTPEATTTKTIPFSFRMVPKMGEKGAALVAMALNQLLDSERFLDMMDSHFNMKLEIDEANKEMHLQVVETPTNIVKEPSRIILPG